jgi:hypothetical protein
MIGEFISEDEVNTFEGWLRYQGVDASTVTPDELTVWRGYFEEGQKRCLATPKVGLMKLQPVPGEYRYAVAVRDGDDLWLTLWVQRNRKSEFFVMVPRGDRDWNPHTSYHLKGQRHSKSYRHKADLTPAQPLNGPFRGTVQLGIYAGHGPKGVGAICNPADFNGVVELAPGILGPRDGVILVDLVEPGCEPIEHPRELIQQHVFRDAIPWVVIGIAS